MKLCMLAFLAASMTSSMEGVLELSPYAMFSKIVVLKRTGSCDTRASCARNHFAFIVRMSTPSSLCQTYISGTIELHPLEGVLYGEERSAI